MVITSFFSSGARARPPGYATSFRVPENGEPAEVLVLECLGTGNPLRFQAPSPRVPGFLKRGTYNRFRVPRNGTRNWHPYSGLSHIHSMNIHRLAKVQLTVANAFPRTSANDWRRAGTPIETNVLFVEKRPMTDDHSIYSARHSTNSIYREIKKNSVNDTLKSFLEKTTEF